MVFEPRLDSPITRDWQSRAYGVRVIRCTMQGTEECRECPVVRPRGCGGQCEEFRAIPRLDERGAYTGVDDEERVGICPLPCVCKLRDGYERSLQRCPHLGTDYCWQTCTYDWPDDCDGHCEACTRDDCRCQGVPRDI